MRDAGIQKEEGLSNDKLSEEIRQAIATNVPLRKKLPGGGRLHIDRQLPFICVFRRPVQREQLAATERLLLGSPSYLLLDGGPENDKQAAALLQTILESLGQYFDQLCLLELWASALDESHSLQPHFDILAPLTQTPVRFLEELENALLHISVEHINAKIAVSYTEQINPAELKPLLTLEQLAVLNCIPVGLVVKPIYLDPETGEVLPFQLDELHHGLNRALKRGFFSFIHEHTQERPSHFHELGRRAMTEAVWETDRQLAEISNSFDLLLYVSPVNSSAAWRQFKKQGFGREVPFLYRARNVNPSLLKRALFQIPIEEIEDPTLAHIFAEKRNELDRQITLLADRNTERFLLGSRQIYGDVEPELLKQATFLLDTIPPSEPQPKGGYLDAKQIAECADRELDKYRDQDPTLKSEVAVRNDVPGILVSQGNLFIGKDASVHESRLSALLNHEVGTHIVTHHNGHQQPFQELYVGMAGYEALQEGLAVLSEYLVGGLQASRLRLLAARVLAVHLITSGASFVECFRTLYKEQGFQPHAAFNITMRVFRGGGYTKDLVYLRGLDQLLQKLADGYTIESLYLGKISHQHLDFIEELQWRQILKPAALMPAYLQSKDAQPRLEALRKGLSVSELIKG